MKYLSGGSDCKESACSAGDPGLIPVLGRSPGEGNSNPLQYSCLESPMDGGVWQALSSPWSCKELDMTEWLHFPYFPRWLPVYIPTNSSIECPFLIITNTCYLLFFDNSHSYRYEIPHCGFDLYFPMISDVEHLFMCLLATVYRLSENAHFKNQVVYNFDRVVWVLCIFWVLAPYWIYHLQISSPVQ